MASLGAPPPSTSASITGSEQQQQQERQQEEKQQQEREEALRDVRRRIEAYETCTDALGAITASLRELDTKLERMKTSTQQLNAFTSGWLTTSNCLAVADMNRRDLAPPPPPAARTNHATATTSMTRPPRPSWNASTRLAASAPGSPPKPQTHHPHRHHYDTRHPPLPSGPAPPEGPRESPRALLERAVTSAISDVLPPEAALDLSFEVSPRARARLTTPSAAIDRRLAAAEDASREWRGRYRRRKHRQATDDARQREFQRALQAARLEFQRHQLALGSLQARIDREVQFLLTTRADLSQRERLLEDAFAGYAELLRDEFGIEREDDDDKEGGDGRRHGAFARAG